MFTTNDLEILAGAALAVLAVGTVVFTAVGGLTYLMFREPANLGPVRATVDVKRKSETDDLPVNPDRRSEPRCTGAIQ